VVVPGADQVWHKELVALVSQVLTSMEGRAKQDDPARWRA